MLTLFLLVMSCAFICLFNICWLTLTNFGCVRISYTLLIVDFSRVVIVRWMISCTILSVLVVRYVRSFQNSLSFVNCNFGYVYWVNCNWNKAVDNWISFIHNQNGDIYNWELFIVLDICISVIYIAGVKNTWDEQCSKRNMAWSGWHNMYRWI